MSGRRMLHKNICTSEKLSSVSEGAECLYYRLLTVSDDLGMFWAEAKIVQVHCFPRRNLSIKTIQRRQMELIKAGLLDKFVRDGQEILVINDWIKYQKLRTDRKKDSFFGMTDGMSSGLPPDNHKVEVKVEEEDKGEGKSPLCGGLSGSIEDRMMIEWRSRNPDQAKAYPRQLAGVKAAVVAALKNGWTAQEIENRIWSTSGQGIPPWELFKSKPSRWDKIKEQIEKDKKEGVSHG